MLIVCCHVIGRIYTKVQLDFKVLLRPKSDFFLFSKIQVHYIYLAKFQIKIRTGSLIILTAIFVIGLPPYLNSKNGRDTILRPG